MTYQRNGAAQNEPPTLMGGIGTADTPAQGISILSAVTGRELAKPSGWKKNLSRRSLTPLLLLLVTGLLGLTYWQYGGNDFFGPLATLAHPPRVNPNGHKPSPLVPAVALAEQSAKPAVPFEAAVVETVEQSAAPTSAPPSLTQNYLNKIEKTPPVIAGSKAKAQPGLARARAMPAKQKTAAKKTAAKKTAAKKVAAKKPPAKVAKARISPAPTAKPTPAQQKQVSVARAADPDEKLLEGMLLLMRKDPPKHPPYKGQTQNQP